MEEDEKSESLSQSQKIRVFILVKKILKKILIKLNQKKILKKILIKLNQKKIPKIIQ